MSWPSCCSAYEIVSRNLVERLVGEPCCVRMESAEDYCCYQV